MQTCRLLPEQQAQQRWLGGSVSRLRSALLQGFDLKNKIKYQLFILHYITCSLTSSPTCRAALSTLST